MIQEIKMPSAGQTTDEATIVSINVKVGDTIKRGDVLMEAETDKAVLPIESYAAGQVLEILVSVGDTVDAGTVLAAVGKPGEVYKKAGAPAPAPAAAPAPVAPVPVTAPAPAAPVAGTEIKMPSAGQTTDDAKIVSVNVKVGDVIKRGDVLVEAETDKAVLPVESFTAGTVLDIRVAVGDQVTAGDVLVVVGKPGQAVAPAPAKVSVAVPPVPAPVKDEYRPIIKGQAPVKPAAPSPVAPVAAPAAPRTAFPAMPNAKMLAKEMGIDLSHVSASNGVFIKRQDVLAYQPAQAEAPAAVAAPVEEKEYEVVPMTKMRTIIGKRMLQSMQEIPAWQATIHVDMGACMALRDTFKQKKDVKLSYNDILAKAIAIAAKKYPLINAHYEQGEVRVYRHTNVGLAVGLESALVVPVAKNIDTKGLVEISKDYKNLVKKARDGKLLPDEMGCGSVTISNLGMYDVDSFIAIVNPPESCILAVGSIRVEPQWDGEKFVPVNRMNITGSFDHRIIDGAYGAQFLQELKVLMENPALMLY